MHLLPWRCSQAQVDASSTGSGRASGERDKALLRNALSKAVRARDRPVLASSIAGPPMGLWRLLARIVHGKGRGVEELARCLEMPAGELRASQPNYCEFEIPKRSGGTRRILAPDDATKALQRRIL